MKFLSAVPTVWEDTIAPNAKVGVYIVIAHRSGDEWFVDAMTDLDPRELTIDLKFLSDYYMNLNPEAME